MPSKWNVFLPDWKEYLPDRKEYLPLTYQKLDMKMVPKILE